MIWLERKHNGEENYVFNNTCFYTTSSSTKEAIKWTLTTLTDGLMAPWTDVASSQGWGGEREGGQRTSERSPKWAMPVSLKWGIYLGDQADALRINGASRLGQFAMHSPLRTFNFQFSKWFTRSPSCRGWILKSKATFEFSKVKPRFRIWLQGAWNPATLGLERRVIPFLRFEES